MLLYFYFARGIEHFGSLPREVSVFYLFCFFVFVVSSFFVLADLYFVALLTMIEQLIYSCVGKLLEIFQIIVIG